MRFDRTKGQTARYMVQVYRPIGAPDQYVYHYMKEAKEMFEKLIVSEALNDKEYKVYISIYDVVKDVLKAREAV